MIIIFLIRRHVNNFIRNARIGRIALVNLTIGSFHKTVFVDSCIRCKRVNQTDVRTFGRLDRTHSSVMRIVNVTNLKSGTVSRKTAGAQRGKTSLMSQLTERVILIHKL